MEAEPGARHSRRVVVASYESYPEAQRAVDYLSDRRFPVERVAIVADDLRFVEQVTGRGWDTGRPPCRARASEL